MDQNLAGGDPIRSRPWLAYIRNDITSSYIQAQSRLYEQPHSRL